jgi:prepilin-type N-terminal cleavage/methylation domain-containing protein
MIININQQSADKRNRRNSMKKLIADIKGVTLIELIIVLTIVAIGAAVAAPNLSGWMARSKLNAEARNLYSVFQLARSEAIKRNQNVVVGIVFGSDYGQTIVCTCVGTNATVQAWIGGTTPATIIKPMTTLPSDIKIFLVGNTGYAGLTTWEYTSRGTFINGDENQPIDIFNKKLTSSNNKKRFTFTLGGSITIN